MPKPVHPRALPLVTAAFLALAGCTPSKQQEIQACANVVGQGFARVASARDERFLGKVGEDVARCNGGERAVAFRSQPWVDWQSYWAAADEHSLRDSPIPIGQFDANMRGRRGALIDLEYQRMQLVKFNLFDNSGTYPDYVRGRDGKPGRAIKVWVEMRLPPGDPHYADVGANGTQVCKGALIRFRTLSGICNDMRNPLMGSTNQPFARNVTFEATFPDLGKNVLARNRHADRIALLEPDPQVISRKLFTRAQSAGNQCNEGQGLPTYSTDARCDYLKAPHFNVLAAFWIQFMTHDWFSHLQEGHNQQQTMAVGCSSQRIDGVAKPLGAADVAALGCRPDDRIDRAYVAQDRDPATFVHGANTYLTRAYRTTNNTVTAWWDASQIYGYDDTSRRRVKRDPGDRAKLLLRPVGDRTGAGEQQGYLPVLTAADPISPQWTGQEAAAFPDNWSIGMSFYHTVFAREHNLFVDAFRRQAAASPNQDTGLRDPTHPEHVMRYKDVSADELFEITRLVIAAEIAKIHTIEWTTQLLYDEPMYLALNSNWYGLLNNDALFADLFGHVLDAFNRSNDAEKQTQWYSVLASGRGIFGIGNDGADVNGGVNHFGSPFNFPEEFVTVYRLHALLPDLLEYRDAAGDPNLIRNEIPVIATLRGQATAQMEQRGLASWALTFGRQRLGLLTLQNHPQFLQNLPIPRMHSATGKIDVPALDLIRDREHGVPRFNEFRRQYGLKQLTSFDDFLDRGSDLAQTERDRQQKLVGLLREIYGQHLCDASKVITDAQADLIDGKKVPIDDCLGRPNGSLVDNIEDLDTIVGWLAEFPRPHGFAISETQFQVFILNASRRLFSDRFFTSSFRKEFYSSLGVDWVANNGPGEKQLESVKVNGHTIEVLPLKRILLRTMPELAPELGPVVNVFDPWARDRGEYYALDWKARTGTESDAAFKH